MPPASLCEKLEIDLMSWTVFSNGWFQTAGSRRDFNRDTKDWIQMMSRPGRGRAAKKLLRESGKTFERERSRNARGAQFT